METTLSKNSGDKMTDLTHGMSEGGGFGLWVDATSEGRDALELAICFMEEYPEVFEVLAGGAEGDGWTSARTQAAGEGEAMATCCAIHDASLERFGGASGIRDEGLLDSALSQPFQSVFGQDLCPTIVHKAARLAYGIAKNHPFLDGNKRTACACMGAYLRLNGVCFKPETDDLLQTMLSVAGGTMSYDELVDWMTHQLPRS